MSAFYQKKNSNRNINDFNIIEEIELASKAGCEHDLNDPRYKPYIKEIFYYPDEKLTEITKAEFSKIPTSWFTFCSIQHDIVQYNHGDGFNIMINPSIELSLEFSEDEKDELLISVSDYNDLSDYGLQFFNKMENAIKHISNLRKFLILK